SLALEGGLGSAVSAVLALLDVAVDDAQWQTLDPQQKRRRTLEAVKLLLLEESRRRPVVLVFEDLHWIDSETQAVLDTLVESLPSHRVLLFVSYRPEYRHTWGGKTDYRQIRIDPLPPESADELLDALLGADVALVPLKRLLVERTEANPLFLRERGGALVEVAAPARARSPGRSSGRPPSSARTCPCRCSWPSPTLRSTMCAPSSCACRPRSSSTRPGSFRTSSTRSSTRSRMRWRTRGCSTTGSAPCTPASPRPSSGSRPNASPSRPSGWPTTPCAGRCGRRRSPISARLGSGPWRGPPTARPLPTWSKRSRPSAVSPRPGRRPSCPSPSGSISGTRSSRSAIGRAW